MAVMTGTEAMQFKWELTARPQAFAGVRRAVDASLILWGLEQFSAAATLCVDELLSNVHKHCDSVDCVLVLQRRGDGLRVTVGDTEPTLPAVRRPDSAAECGRGMLLISSMADAWGADRTPTGKNVWAEFHAVDPLVGVAVHGSRSV